MGKGPSTHPFVHPQHCIYHALPACTPSSGNPPASAIILNSRLGALGMICSFTYFATSWIIIVYPHVHQPTRKRTRPDQAVRTFNKSVDLPRSTGPARLPSSSMRRCSPVVVFASRAEASGACMKQVKWRSVSRLSGTAVWPPAAAAACMLAKSSVVSRNLARSKGDLSAKGKREARDLCVRIGRVMTWNPKAWLT